SMGLSDWADKLDFTRPALRDGEITLAAFPANSGLHGGRLIITTERLIFQPHRVSRMLRAKSWSGERGEIKEIVPDDREVALTFEDGGRREVRVREPDTVADVLNRP